MDTLCIQDLKVTAIIGCHSWERQLKQHLRMDVLMRVDVRNAAASDNLNDAMDYAVVAKAVSAFVEASEYNLLETLAEKTAAFILSDFAVTWCQLTITKPGAVPHAKAVTISISRSESGDILKIGVN